MLGQKIKGKVKDGISFGLSRIYRGTLRGIAYQPTNLVKQIFYMPGDEID